MARRPWQHDGRTQRELLLVDDHAAVREGLKHLLEVYPDIVVVAEAADGEQAVVMAGHHQPDLIVMDINMPKLNGIDATSQIKQAWPHITVIGLSVDWSPPIYTAMVKAGAVTLIQKEAAVDQLYPLIQNVLPAP
jgi:DNA-binding NarL/FixJ family response regulator